MKIAVLAPSPVPFAVGGAERAVTGLVDALQAHGHDAELLKLPVREHDLSGLMAGYEAFWRLDVSHFDVAISTKYPAWMVRHPHHVVWMFHKLRGLYDTYHLFELPEDVPHAEPDIVALLDVLRRAPEPAVVEEVLERVGALLASLGAGHPALQMPGALARRIVHFLDAAALAPGAVRRHVALSRTVAERRDYFPPGVVPAVVHSPSSLAGLHGGRFESFFTASRLDGPKRVALLIEAMRHVGANVQLLIGGTGPLAEELSSMAAGDPRVRLLGYVPDDELVERYASALAVPFVPADEDLGLITLEAMVSGKPVVTCVDSGGPTELVEHGRTGLICAPEPAALGAALDRLAGDRALAQRLGEAGRRRAAGITWDRVVGQLLGGATASGPARRPHRRPHVVVTSTFPVAPRLGGGQLRSYHLYGTLAERFDVEIVSLAPPGGRATRSDLGAGFVETSVPVSSAHAAVEADTAARVGLPVTDILAGPLIHLTPEYVEALIAAAHGATAVLLAHPFLLPAVDLAGIDVPVVYDAHNAELRLKDSVLPRDAAGDELRRLVSSVEGAAVARAALTAVCSMDDARALQSDHGLDPTSALHVPNGVAAGSVPFVAGHERRRAAARWRAGFGDGRHRAVAGFIGSWHPPNLDAVEQLIEMAAAMPDVAFVVAGSVCDHYRGWRVPSNLALLGTISPGLKDMLLSSLDVALNPMRRGSGSNLKLVEYLAAGCPVVTTPLGVRGIEADDGTHLVVAELEAFPSAISNVVDDPEAADARAHAGRRLIEERYDWGPLGRRLADAIAKVAMERSALVRR